MRSAIFSSSVARSFGELCAQPSNACSAAATAALTWAVLAAATAQLTGASPAPATAAIFLPVAASSTCSTGPSPGRSRPPINNCVCITLPPKAAALHVLPQCDASLYYGLHNIYQMRVCHEPRRLHHLRHYRRLLQRH